MKNNPTLRFGIFAVVMVLALIIFTKIALPSDISTPRREPSNTSDNTEKNEMIDMITIRVNDRGYKVSMDSNEAAQEFAQSTPFELPMTELNGNEKYYTGSDKLKADPSVPDRINIGDLMLYGDDTIVLFYDEFKTEYSYTRLGWVRNIDDLPEVLGSGDVTITFTKN